MNGVTVSDFYTPHFFDPVFSPTTRYSFTGAITKPRQILRNGYISWHDPISDHWFQEIWFNSAKPKFRDLGPQTAKPGENLRSMIYRLTPERLKAKQMIGKNLQLARAAQRAMSEATGSEAKALRKRISEVIGVATKK